MNIMAGVFSFCFFYGWWTLTISGDFEIHKFLLGLGLLTIALLPGIFIIFEMTKSYEQNVRQVFIALFVLAYLILFGGSFYWKNLTTGTYALWKEKTSPLPTATPVNTELDTKTKELEILKNRAVSLLVECGNKNRDQDAVIFSGEQKKWYRDMRDFLVSDFMRNDDEFRHWRGTNDKYCHGVGFEEMDLWAKRPMTPTPEDALSNDDFATLQRKIWAIRYYLSEMNRRKKGLPPLCP